jgi:predicted transposase YbfD/YdcC
VAAVAEWASDTPQPVRAALGARREAPDRYSAPSEATIRRTLVRLDAEVLAEVIGAWLANREGADRRRRAVAVDGKTLRGSGGDGHQMHLLAAMEHTSRRVLAQREVDGAPGEVPGFVPLLEPVDLAGAVVTADALHTHREHADWLVADKQADYLFTVKANQPTLLDRCQRLAWHNVPELDRTRDHAHGRVEIRTLRAVSVLGFGFPHAAQVLQVTRKVRDRRTGRRRKTQIAYAVTSLAHAHASPARLADLIRGHWAIENGLHHVRDVTFAEDVSQLRTGAAPQVMAALRNLAIGVLSHAGPVNLAAALRHHSRDPYRPLATLGISLGFAEPDITQERRNPAAWPRLGTTASARRYAWSMSAACWSKTWTMLPDGSENDANRPPGMSMTSPTHRMSGCCLVKAMTSSTWKYAPEPHRSLLSGRASSMSCTGEPGSSNATVDSPSRQASSRPSSSR